MRIKEEPEYFGVTLHQKQRLERLCTLYKGRYRTISYWLRCELGHEGRSCKELAKKLGIPESVIRRWAGLLGLRPPVKARRTETIYLGPPCKTDINHIDSGHTPRYVKGKRCVYCSDAYNAERRKERRRKRAKV